MKKETNGWDFFDRIYCISLEEREDRRQSAAASFAKVGLTGKVEFVLVKLHPSNVEQGMYESHMTCLRKGLEAGAKSIVVFEDDVIFDRFDAAHFQTMHSISSGASGLEGAAFGGINTLQPEND